MFNQEIANILKEFSELLEMKRVPFKPRAYEKAAMAISMLDKDISDLYKAGGLKALEEIAGVGRGIAERIEEYIKTGHMRDYEKLKKKLPVDLRALTSIEGVGPHMVKMLYDKLHIKDIDSLERAAQMGKIRTLPHFGVKSEKKILDGIAFYKKSRGRMSLGEAFPVARSIVRKLQEMDVVLLAEAAGSMRRWEETIGDIDILVVSNAPKQVMDFFSSMPEVTHVYAKGLTKTMVRFRPGIDVDLRIVPRESFGAALQYFTGNKSHNIKLRKIAIEKGYKLNEYGLFTGKGKRQRSIAGKTEEEIYKALGMQCPPPEMRLNVGEIELAKRKKLPRLITIGDLKGDLQVQTFWTDGSDTIEEMAKEARAMGHAYIAITDHTKGLPMTGGSDEKRLLKQIKEIKRVNKKIRGISILSGAEVNIMKDGSLDIADTVLKKLDVVGAGIHSHFQLSRKDQTKRVIKTMENPHVDILFHPTARLINKREPVELDMEQIFKAARRTGTALEINAHPMRLDLKGEYIRKAKQMGAKFVISTDAHSKKDFQLLEYGIGQARRGGLEKKDVLNTRPLRSFLKSLK
ncbi:MAG: DNA polymerase III [Candidatus Ryanbacteria bacterium RIFCSPHIGHO2_02_FULL_45_43]|uniref:DNA polymerase beta n=1 Tax=Candidatus Ryanbacteria bacterium RIFCSPHIGHO2_01_45_13 TaxID=1802112 RepID=A0A1G2FWJ2_9BACT|nr:MAG: DNA polymerase III [Candidatus Ryanbacteria bacterium RIFCSPHIGHO2_01_FULL_44_130]OGZ42433.1 MAG: DNA polymerase III [Candidatus Ryanbacteria bacterium RIFCSPHIGHO2_01_45_13]OGZ48450.1 MAG: DNA polymerase III [Candidatus Ryanbacteria bacterium RIFCSPHIGHO2_02_FULL_45_43]OGZ50315.1 MAG: DNA polymerase III [Candidatus Ryanbacteria bacterium RIFCSPHIGHO2_12_FULL_44_20]OGZ51654.1 MAG: DNA polymerase III [Candidatus Ryanbacteria bacterium RIFCSPLOWO2_01_FULL_44_230]OGZ54592.1 MAG: DNA polym